MEIYGFNKLVATEPFKDTEAKTVTQSGFAVFMQKGSLTQLKVLMGNLSGSIPKGSIIYVSSELFKMPWATKVYNVVGPSFILVPEDMIQLIGLP